MSIIEDFRLKILDLKIGNRQPCLPAGRSAIKKSKGFTLIELVIATAIISILTLMMGNFVAGRIADNAVKNATAELQLQTQIALDSIGQDIKLSANIDSSNRWEDDYAPGAPADLFSWDSDSDTLILARPVIKTDNTVAFEDPQTYITYKDNVIYFLSKGTLYKRILASEVNDNKAQTTCPVGGNGCPADDALLADNVDVFSIVYYDANDNAVSAQNARSVEVTLRVSRQAFNETLEVEESIRSVFRNE